MNAYFVAAAGLVLVLAISHSVLGELLLIRRLSNDGLPALAPFSLIEMPKMGLTGSPEMARRTLRCTWHLPGVLGLGFAAILLWLALPTSRPTESAFLQTTMALTFIACSLVVLFLTSGRHPGWVAFAAIGILTLLA